jgi:lysophospholipase L1-like esterase
VSVAKLKLAVIGDSLTQGFQSGAISKTTWSFPAILARAFGVEVPGEFLVPSFPGPGLPLNIEDLLRQLELRTGPKTDAVTLGRVLTSIPSYLDELEDLYERGVGSRPPKFSGVYSNLAVWGFALADALRLTPMRSRRAIEESEGWIEDDFLGLPSGPMYRTAQRVLNPGDESERRGETQLDALERCVRSQGGVDAVIVWLGANDALGTVLTLDVRDMERVSADALPSDPVALLKWNLTSKARFEEEYRQIVARVSDIVSEHSPGAAVFVATIPYVTIPPITRGVGRLQGKHFDHYRRFFVKSDSGASPLEGLTRHDVELIEARIDGFNALIRSEALARGFHVVEVAKMLDLLAVRRNGTEDAPDKPLRDFLGDAEHPLLRLNPVPNILMYELDANGARAQGGLFSLDGVHPSTAGYGLIAEEFLKTMRAAGVPDAERARIPWAAVIANDSLLQHPPRLWQPLLDQAEQHATLWGLLARALA